MMKLKQYSGPHGTYSFNASKVYDNISYGDSMLFGVEKIKDKAYKYAMDLNTGETINYGPEKANMLSTPDSTCRYFNDFIL